MSQNYDSDNIFLLLPTNAVKGQKPAMLPQLIGSYTEDGNL